MNSTVQYSCPTSAKCPVLPEYNEEVTEYVKSKHLSDFFKQLLAEYYRASNKD